MEFNKFIADLKKSLELLVGSTTTSTLSDDDYFLDPTDFPPKSNTGWLFKTSPARASSDMPGNDGDLSAAAAAASRTSTKEFKS